MSSVRTDFRWLFVVVCSLAASSASALDSFARTPQEEAMCKAMVYGPEAKDRNSRENWMHMHHYCDCIRFRYRALRKIGNKMEFTGNLNQALAGCDYVLRNTTPTFGMRAKVMVDKGRALKVMGEKGRATEEFSKAIQFDQSEVNAYYELSELQEESGNKSEAKDTVVLGLRRNPGAKLLQKRYLALGGKEPFPEPIVRAGPEPQDAPQELPQPEPIPRVDADGAQRAQVLESPNGGPQQEHEVDSGRSCRFCPPEEIQRRWTESFKATPEKKGQ